MSSDAVLVDVRDHIGLVTLARPDNRNSMTTELLDAFQDAIATIQANKDLRCVVITGSGSCFSAGADLRAQIQRDGDERTPQERSYAMYTPFLSVLDVEVPVIGALNGHAVGGGFGLALVCDIRIGNQDAKYGANFARLGLHPGMAISYLLPRLVGISQAADLLFTGRLVRGQEAAQMGLLSAALEGESVLPRAMEMAGEIAGNAPLAVRMMKKTFYEGLGWSPREAAWREAAAQAQTVATDDAAEGISALLAKRTPEFHGR